MNAAAFARAQWRRLPLDFRRAVGGEVMRAAMPLLARRLPHANPAFAARPAEAVALYGMFGAAVGHTVGAKLLRLELQAAGVTVCRRDMTALAGAAEAEEAGFAADPPPPADAPAVIVANPDTVTVAFAGPERAHLHNRRVIGFWVWELEQAPRHWAIAAEAVHEVWTPSAFSAEALRRVLPCPVHVALHPVALDPPPLPDAAARVAARARFGAAPEDFVAVSSFAAGSNVERKNPLAALRAFEDAFDGARDALLILRCLGAAQFPEALAPLRAAIRDSRARVLLLDQPGGLSEMHALYAACDAYLSLHRCEGFGLNLAEAMLCGRPVIATAYSAPLEFMDAGCALPVPARLVPVRDPQRIYRVPGAVWAEPEHEAAVTALRALRADPALGARLGAAAIGYARQRLSGGAAARALRGVAG